MKQSSRRKPSAPSGPQPTAASKTPATTAAAASNLRAWGIAAGFLLLGFLIYFPSLSGPFVLDDFDLMEVFSAVRIGDWNAVWLTGRPLVMLTYVWNHRMAGGFHPFPFHLTNVLLHAFNAILLWRLLATLAASARFEQYIPAKLRTLLVYAVPLLFLATPLQTESVAYISSRTELLSVSFYLLALWTFASKLRESRPWICAVLVMVLAGCAALSKQDKVTVPLAILLMDYFFLAQMDWRKLKDNLATYALFAAGLVAAFFVVIKPFLFAGSAGFNLDWQTYLFTQFRMVFLYLRLLLVPVGLNLDRYIEPSRRISEHLAWLALLGIVVLLVLIVKYHRRMPVVAFGALFFFLTLAPSTSFYPLLDFAAERRLYLPSIGFFLAALALLYYVSASIRAVAYSIVALTVLYSVGTYQRNIVWASDLALWQDTAEKSPEKARPWTWLGRIYIERGKDVQALQVLERGGMVVEPGTLEHAHLLNNVGLAYAHLKEYGKAIDAYRQASEIAPDETLFKAHLAVALIRAGRVEEGWQAFAEGDRILNADPSNPITNPEFYFLRGQENFQQGKYGDAVKDFQESLRQRPDNPQTVKNLAAAQEMQRRRGR